ncbi:hypothetical protein F4818DRAFT_419365 [Hypoxylon cercidicola]|nr:hypothetical protein F4818DRAFT_419365 [Hypoxylon cercidicola]
MGSLALPIVVVLAWQLTGIYAASDESDPPDCTEISFTSPGWIIPALVTTHVNASGPIGSIYFSVDHHATNLSTVCSAEGWIDIAQRDVPEFAWYSCATPETRFQFDPEASLLTLQTNWTCATSPTLDFSATGSTTVPPGPPCPETGEGDPDCVPRNIEVEATLTSPVKIQPTEPQLPQKPPNGTTSCVDRSTTPAWHVTDLLYQHFHSSNFSATELYYVLSLSVTNWATNESVLCSATVDELAAQNANHSAQWLECNYELGSISASTLSTQFMFDLDYSLLGIKQTWDCPEASSTSDSFVGTGYLVEPLRCGSPAEKSHLDEQGNLIAESSQYNCSLPATTVYGYSGDGPALPHTPYTRSCTTHSFSTTSMQLQDYEIEAFASASDGTPPTDPRRNATFAIYNDGSGDAYQISTPDVRTDGIWHECASGGGSQPWQLALCQYLLDRAQGILAFEMQWYCDDRDPQHAILFTATAVAQLPGEECDTFEGVDAEPRIRCHLPRNSSTAVLNVDSLTWESLTRPMDRGPPLPWV